MRQNSKTGETKTKLLFLQTWIGSNFTWMFIGVADGWIVFIVVVYIYYGDIRLGAPDSKPEYNNLTWFTMLFACAVGIGRMIILMISNIVN